MRILSFCFFLLVGLWGQGLPAQALYFWTQEGKVSLVEDRTSVVLHFDEAVSAPAVLSAATRSQVRDRDARRQLRQSVVLDLVGLTYRTSDEAARQLVQAGSPLRSAAFALRINGGMKAWPTHRIAYRPGAAFDARRFEEMLAAQAGVRTYRTPGGVSMIEVEDLSQVIPLANALYETGMFAWCHPDLMAPLRAQSTQGTQGATQCFPDDSLFNAPLYYLHNNGGNFANVYPYANLRRGIDIDAPEAWCITKGLNTTIIAIVDEGVEDHEDLMDDINLVSRVLPGYTVSDTVDGVGAPENDGDAHGQAVAGIIAASHNDIGVSGVAPEVRILPVHVFTDGSTSASELADGINWAWQNGADIINNSWVYDTCVTSLFPVVEQAIHDAVTLGRGGLGSLVVFSSGSEFDSICVGYPATLPEVLAVGAVDARATIPSYASYGPELDLVGVSSPSNVNNITVMDRMGNLGYNTDTVAYENYDNRNYTKWFGGTSATAAQASGVAALILAIDSTLSESAIRNFLTSTATDMGPSGPDALYGYGRINAFEAVSAVQATFPVEWLSFEGAVSGQEIVLDWVTASESNNDRFVVERQGDQGFRAIGEVAGTGNASSPVAYRFFDVQPLPGRNLYRLRQVDFDGQSSYSATVEVLFPADGISTLYPNPATEVAAFQVYARRGARLSWYLYDLQGRLLQQAALPLDSQSQEVKVPVSDLLPGHYLLRIETSEGDIERLRLQVRE